MKSILLAVLFLFIESMVGVPPVTAAGIGVYGSLGAGNADWTVDSGSNSSADFSKHTNHVGFGLAMDTAPARDTLFNYQLNLGYDQFRNNNGSAWGDAALDSFVISNNFGFGTLIDPKTRLWIGPELRIVWVDGSPDKYSDFKIHLFGVGIGPVIGVNFNYDDLHTFAIKAGFQYINYAGVGSGHYSHATNTAVYSYPDYDTTEKMLYVTFEFLFRTSRDR